MFSYTVFVHVCTVFLSTSWLHVQPKTIFHLAENKLDSMLDSDFCNPVHLQHNSDCFAVISSASPPECPMDGCCCTKEPITSQGREGVGGGEQCNFRDILKIMETSRDLPSGNATDTSIKFKVERRKSTKSGPGVISILLLVFVVFFPLALLLQ